MMDTPPQASKETQEYFRREIERMGGQCPKGADAPTWRDILASNQQPRATRYSTDMEIKWLEEDLARLRDDMESERFHLSVIIALLVIALLASWAMFALSLTAGAP